MPEVNSLVNTYDDQGYLTGLDIFSTEEIAYFRSKYDELEASDGKENCQFGIAGRHFDEEFIWRLSASHRVLDVVDASRLAPVNRVQVCQRARGSACR